MATITWIKEAIEKNPSEALRVFDISKIDLDG